VIWVVKKYSLVKKVCEMKPARTKLGMEQIRHQKGKRTKISENSDSEISTSKIHAKKGIKYTCGKRFLIESNKPKKSKSKSNQTYNVKAMDVKSAVTKLATGATANDKAPFAAPAAVDVDDDAETVDEGTMELALDVTMPEG